MKRQSLAIIPILVIGSLFGVAYSASTIISDSGITTPTITVSGACNGCGNEPSFTSWATVLNETVAGSQGKQNSGIAIGNDGSVLFSDSGFETALVLVNGTVVTVTPSPDVGLTIPVFSLSSTGEYKIIEYSNGIHVYKNNILVKTLGVTLAQFKFGVLGNEGISISPDGKYIALQGIDSGATSARLLIFEGS